MEYNVNWLARLQLVASVVTKSRSQNEFSRSYKLNWSFPDLWADFFAKNNPRNLWKLKKCRKVFSLRWWKGTYWKLLSLTSNESSTKSIISISNNVLEQFINQSSCMYCMFYLFCAENSKFKLRVWHWKNSDIERFIHANTNISLQYISVWI